MEQVQKWLHRAQAALGRYWRRVRQGNPLDIAILAAAVLLAVVLALILIFSLTQSPKQGGRDTMDIVNSAPSAVTVDESGYNKAEGDIDKAAYDGTVLVESEDAGQKYLDETLFVGDSNTARMVDFGVSTLKNNLGVVGMGVQHVTGSACVQFKGYGYIYVPKAVSLMQPKRIIITFGTNNAYETTDTFIKWYKSALDAITEVWPYADIIINAVPPVAKTRSYPNITMKTIDSFNKALVQLARDEGYQFLDSSEALKGTDGYAKEGYMEKDGIHLTQKGMTVLTDYFRTHPYETQDRRPKPLSTVPTHYATPESFFAPPEPASSEPESTAPVPVDPATCTHNYSLIGETPATCGADGSRVYQCTICGTQTAETLPATGNHTYEKVEEVAAQVGVEGYRKFRCTVCGYEYTEKIAALAPPASSTVPTPEPTPDPVPTPDPAPPVVDPTTPTDPTGGGDILPS